MKDYIFKTDSNHSSGQDPPVLLLPVKNFNTLIWLVAIFIIGYLFITLEHTFHINKAATALLTGVLCWTVYALETGAPHAVGEQLTHHLSEISAILFFLLGAITIVEVIDLHDGFEVIVKRIQTNSTRKLMWILADWPLCFRASSTT